MNEDPVTVLSCNILRKKEYKNNEEIEVVTFTADSGLSEIPKSCFAASAKLREFHCPSSVVTISENAFEDCVCLSKFVLKEDSMLRSIGDNAFKGCAVHGFSITKNLAAEKCDFIGIIGLGENYSCDYVVSSGLLINAAGDKLLGVFLEHESVCIPSSVQVLQNGAFHSNLKEVSFQEGSKLEKIQSDAFQMCFIEKLVLPPSFQDVSQISHEYVGKVEFEVGNPNFETFDDFVFSSDSRILWKYFGNEKEIIIPCYVEQIGARFCMNSSIERVFFEEGSEVTVIGSGAFYKSSIVSIELPDSVRTLQQNCFFACHNLQNVSFGKESMLESIESSCFGRCECLVELEFPGSVRQLGMKLLSRSGVEKVSFISSKLEFLVRNTFCQSKLTRIIIPMSVEIISFCCFWNCNELKEVYFEKGTKLREMHESCFRKCAIETICIPRSVRTIECDCFSYCENLHVIEFETGIELKTLSDSCFRKTGIETICIPKSVVAIESECFSECEKLRLFYFEDGSLIKEVGDVFGDAVHDVKAIIPKSVEVLAPEFLSYLSDIEFESGSSFSVEGNRVLYQGGYIGILQRKESPVDEPDVTKDCNHISVFQAKMYANAPIENIVIPKGVEIIEKECFYSSTLKILQFEHGSELKKICRSAFEKCRLERVVIPCLVEAIQDSAFAGCKCLKNVDFECGSQLRFIGCRAFAATALTSISIPDSVTHIVDACFIGTQLLECKIGENSQLETLGEGVFNECHIPYLFIPANVSSLTSQSRIGIDEIAVSPANPHFCVLDNLLMSPDRRTLLGMAKLASSIRIPKEVRVIEKECFIGMKILSSVEFEEGSELEVIGDNAFTGTSLVHIELPRNIRQLGEKCFNVCTNNLNISFHEHCPLENIPLLSDEPLVNLTFNVPVNVSRIEKETLRMARKVTSSTGQLVAETDFLVSYRSGESLLISEVGRLKRVLIPKFITRIAEDAFQRSDIISVEFEAGSQLTELCRYAFARCRNLKTVSFDNVSNLKIIRECAFYECYSLSVEIPKTVEVLEGRAFAFVRNVSVQEGSFHLSVSDGMLMNRQTTALFGFYMATSGLEFVLDRSIQTIGKFCFKKKSGRRFAVEDGSVLENIEESAFFKSDFKDITLPSTIMTIGENCFSESQLVKFQIKGTPQLTEFAKGVFEKSQLLNFVVPVSVEELGSGCFMDCAQLASVSFENCSCLICIKDSCFRNCTSLESIELERCKNIRYIHERAFEGTKLTKVTLHPGMNFLAESAFSKDCNITVTENLEDLALAEWVADRNGSFVRKRENNFYLGIDFSTIKTLGFGSFGEVFLVENRFTSERFAVKTIHGATGNVFEREIEFMMSLRHPCIVSLKGFSLRNPMSLCMEYAAGGTLKEALLSRPAWFDATCKSIIITGIVIGMSAIHSREALHRDLKPENILLTSSHEAKISDFGTARFEDNSGYTIGVGTPVYMAPELLSESSDITRKVDVFSFGLILYQMVEDVSVSELRNRINDLKFSCNTPYIVTTIIEACLDLDPAMRPEFREILEELKQVEFQLVPGTDAERVSKYYNRISSQSE